jgi:lipid A 4'-phosphatase
MKKGIVVDIILPLILLMGLTIMFWITDLDLWISGHFFVPGEGWVPKDGQPWRFLYDYGPFPALLLAIGALIIFIASFWSRTLISYRKAALFCVLLILIGPGLVVNVIFKDHWGRPRPKYVQEFSGPNPFHYVWQKGEAGNGHSFPSGHASMGFFLIAPYFVLRKTSKKWAYVFLTIGICWGLTIGFARIVQGGHFASDVIWAGGLVYFFGLGLSSALRLDHRPRHLSDTG